MDRVPEDRSALGRREAAQNAGRQTEQTPDGGSQTGGHGRFYSECTRALIFSNKYPLSEGGDLKNRNIGYPIKACESRQHSKQKNRKQNIREKT